MSDEILTPAQRAALQYAVQARDHAESELEEARTQNLAKQDAVAAMCRALAETAEAYGVVVTMHTAPRHPPVMGRYDMRWEVRPSREMYQQEMQLEATAKAAQKQVDNLVTAGPS